MTDSFCIQHGGETLAEAARLLVEDSHDHHALVVEVADAEIRALRAALRKAVDCWPDYRIDNTEEMRAALAECQSLLRHA